MVEVTCSGLPAAWVNGWLAAVGATILDARIRLHWTTDGEPLAVLSASEVDPVDALVESWPDTEVLADLPIAENWKDAGELRRKVHVETFVERARTARAHRHSWTLSSTMTDLCVDKNGEVAHAPFDPAGPGTIKWLHHRLMKLHEQLEPSPAQIGDSLAGCANRVQDNGLGFDQTRLGSLSDETSMWIDPVVEELAFFGLAMLPVRGPEPTGDWTAAPMFEGGREGGESLQGVGMRTASTGLHGASRSIVPASTRSWMPGTQSESPHGSEWASTQVGGASGLSPGAQPTQRGRLEPNSCERRARRPDLRHRTLRVLSSAMRSHPLRQRMDRQRPHCEGSAGASPGRQRTASARTRPARASCRSTLVRGVGIVRPRRCSRNGKWSGPSCRI